VVSINGDRRYTALFRKQDLGSWVLKTSIPAAEYQSEYDANAAAGRAPYFVNAFMHAGAIHYTAAFAQRPAGQRKDRHNLTAAAFQAEFDSAMAAGLSLRSVAGIDGWLVHQFVAVWRR
jgi:hypothetical protein